MEKDETEESLASAVRIPSPPDLGGFNLIFPLLFFCKIELTLKKKLLGSWPLRQKAKSEEEV